MVKRRGFLLVVVLAVCATVLILTLAVSYQSRQSRLRTVFEQTRFQEIQTVDDTMARMGMLLQSPDSPPDLATEVSLTDSFHSAPVEGDLAAQVDWEADSGSVYQAWQSSYATPDNLWNSSLPPTGYDASVAKAAMTNVKLAPEHTGVSFDFNEKSYQTVFSPFFPMACYAPQGSITMLGDCASLVNPTFSTMDDAQDKLEVAQFSGVPVLLQAAGDVTVEGQFPHGRAYADAGTVQLKGGAIAYAGVSVLANGPFEASLTSSLDDAFDSISDGQVTKTNFIVGQVLDVEGFIGLITGDQNFGAIFSVDQGSHIPFPPWFGTDNFGVAQVVKFYLPMPPDTSGTSVDQNDIDNLATLGGRSTELQADIDDLDAQIAAEKAKDDPDDDKIDDLQSERNSKQDELDTVNDEISALNDEINTDTENISNLDSSAFGEPPTTYQESLSFVTKGWAYARLLVVIVDDLLTILLDLISLDFDKILKDIEDDLLNPTRVIHLSGDDPHLWVAHRSTDTYDLKEHTRPDYIDNKWNSWRVTFNVSEGRTCRLEGDFQFRGDVWLQKGATLHVTGDLSITTPEAWTEFGDEIATADFYPKGRLHMEEGSTLLVGGDLTIDGGSTSQGSVLLVTDGYEVPKSLSRAILCKGHVTIENGIFGGIGISDALSEADPDDAGQVGQASELTKLFGFLGQDTDWWARFPYLGPFSARSSYFASYATTFVTIPPLVEFGLAGPWPIPIPYENCWNNVFYYWAYGYSIELNMFLGPHLITHSTVLWPWGKGVVPTMVKCDPEFLADVFGSIDFDQIDETASADAAQELLTEVLPDVLFWLIVDRTAAVAEDFLEVSGYKLGCGKSSTESDTAENDPEDDTDTNSSGWSLSKVWKKVKELWPYAKYTKKLFSQLSLPLTDMKSHIRTLIYSSFFTDTASDFWDWEEAEETSDDPSIPPVELPGVLVYSAGDLTLGTTGEYGDEPTPLVSGMFVAQGDLTSHAKRTVGCLISFDGDIMADGVYYYPYFTRSSFFNQEKPADMKGSGYDVADFFTAGQLDEVVNDLFTFGAPKGGEALPMGQTFYHVLSEGWHR
jgi:hypothetical protein